MGKEFSKEGEKNAQICIKKNKKNLMKYYAAK